MTDVVAASNAGDHDAIQVIAEGISHLSGAIINAAYRAEARVVVLGGGVMVYAGLFPMVKARIENDSRGKIVARQARYGNLSSLYGAALICRNNPGVLQLLGDTWTGRE